MKYLTLILLFFLISTTTKSQDITGQWNGKLKIQGIELRVVFNISKNDTTYTATMDSPDQGAKGIPVDKVTYNNHILKLEIKQPGINYNGTYNKDTIEGTFMQSGLSFPLNLTREKLENEVNNRPQEPQLPYPYISEEVKFENSKDQVVLAGTLTLPNKDGHFPAVVLISGSGPQNRNEEVFGHKPFLVLSDYLTRNNIAVLRYDDRGTAQSSGNNKTATTLDLSRDAESAVKYLLTRNEIDKNKIGLIGHSEGGVIAPIVASNSNDINFIVLLAGLGMPADELLLLQDELIGKAYGVNDSILQTSNTINKEVYNIVIQNNKPEIIKQKLSEYINHALQDNPDFPIPGGMNKEDYIKMQIETLASPWMSYFLKINIEGTLKKVKCPVLALNGAKDLQVPATENLNGIKKALEEGGNKNVTIQVIPNLNHLFQKCQSGLPLEYSTIKQTFSPDALELIYKWIETQTK